MNSCLETRRCAAGWCEETHAGGASKGWTGACEWGFGLIGRERARPGFWARGLASGAQVG